MILHSPYIWHPSIIHLFVAPSVLLKYSLKSHSKTKIHVLNRPHTHTRTHTYTCTYALMRAAPFTLFQSKTQDGRWLTLSTGHGFNKLSYITGLSTPALLMHPVGFFTKVHAYWVLQFKNVQLLFNVGCAICFTTQLAGEWVTKERVFQQQWLIWLYIHLVRV